MLNKQAFSLIELSVYLAIFSIFSLISFSFLSQSYKEIICFQIKMKKEIQNSLAYDLLFRDFISAKTSAKFWSKINQNTIPIDKFTFRKDLKDIGWLSRTDGLFRINGSYDFNQMKWIKKNSARINTQSQNLSIKILLKKNKDAVFGIDILSDNNSTLFVKLRNGISNVKVK